MFLTAAHECFIDSELDGEAGFHTVRLDLPGDIKALRVLLETAFRLLETG